MPNVLVSRFASFADAATTDRALRPVKKAPPRARATVAQTANVKSTLVPKQSRFALMAAAAVNTSSRVASAGARAVTLTGKRVTKAITPNEEADIRHDITWFGRVRPDAERNVTLQQKCTAAKRMRKSAEAGIARSSTAYRQVR
jgi:hypothetical protein